MSHRISADAFRARYGAPPAGGATAPRLAAPWPPGARETAGRAADAAGKAMEAGLADLHALYAAQGRAHILRRPHETRHTKAGIVHAAKTGADYAGVLRGGRAVTMEAKSIDEGGVRGAVLSGLRSWPAAELADLRRTAALGGVAVIVADVRAGRWAGRYVVPVPYSDWNLDCVPVPLAGDRSAVCNSVRVADGLDWLAVVEAWQ